MRTLRKTERFSLIEGSLQSRGCFRVVREHDDAISLWMTGSEGREEAYKMRRLPDGKFDAAASNRLAAMSASERGVLVIKCSKLGVYLYKYGAYLVKKFRYYGA